MKIIATHYDHCYISNYNVTVGCIRVLAKRGVSRVKFQGMLGLSVLNGFCGEIWCDQRVGVNGGGYLDRVGEGVLSSLSFEPNQSQRKHWPFASIVLYMDKTKCVQIHLVGIVLLRNISIEFLCILDSIRTC